MEALRRIAEAEEYFWDREICDEDLHKDCD